MGKFKSIKRSPERAKKGFTLIELLIVLAIVAYGVMMAGWEKLDSARRAVALAAAGQVNLVGIATQAYLAYNLPTFEAATPTGNLSTAVTIAQLKAAGSCGNAPCLSPSVSNTNAWGAGYTIKIRRLGVDTPYGYEFLVVTTGPAAASGSYDVNGKTRIDLVTYAATRTASSVGFTYVPIGGVIPVATGGSWAGVTQANYPAIAAGVNGLGGQLAYFVPSVTTPPPMYDGFYLRTDGGNKMTANMNVNGHGIYGVNQGINDPAVASASSVATGNGLNMATSNLTGDSTVGGNILAGSSIKLSSNTGDIQIASLLTTAAAGGHAHSTNSLVNSVPALVDVYSQIVKNGDTVPVPVCASGTPLIYFIPSGGKGTVNAGRTGYGFTASPQNAVSGFWTVAVEDGNGNPPAAGEGTGIARTSCGL